MNTKGKGPPPPTNRRPDPANPPKGPPPPYNPRPSGLPPKPGAAIAPKTPAAQVTPLHRKGADLLLAAKALTPEQFSKLLQHVERSGERSEDGVLTLGMMSEGDLLKALSAFYKTRFVSSEKLAKAEIPRATLELVPRKIAEKLGVFPVVFDGEQNSLMVVSADPDNYDLLSEVELVAGVREVKAYVARPAAIRAAIARFYAGEQQAFNTLEKVQQTEKRARIAVVVEKPDEDVFVIERQQSRFFGGVAAEQAPQPAAAPPPVAPAPPPVAAAPAPAPPPPPPPPPSEPATLAEVLPKLSNHDALLELLNVMVSLLENSRAELRGHSAQVARLAKRIAERMELPKASVLACTAAAYIHDLGKMGQYHLTAHNCAEYDGHKIAAQKAVGTPARLLEAVRLMPDALEAVTSMYERYDGKGFPDGLQGKEIPLGARILSLVDTYADLTQNSRNPYRKTLSPQEAFGAIWQNREKIFDPHLVDLFRALMMGEDLRARLLANRYVALVVDADPEETTVLELRMLEQGFEVKIARTVEEAMKKGAEGDIDIVVSELDMPSGDGLALLAEARKSWGKDMPWVIYTRRTGRAEAQRAFELGVIDYASKLATTDVLVAKLKALLDQRATGKGARGVSGSLSEMSLPDMIQLLWHGRKSGALRIRANGELGEIQFAEGQVMDATWGKLRGVDAFYALMKLTDGDFGLDPSVKVTNRAIQETSEMLLFEAMRQMDEGH